MLFKYPIEDDLISIDEFMRDRFDFGSDYQRGLEYCIKLQTFACNYFE
ncbi:hypothetical protein [Pleurocapsa sp. PCC 7319]|nr:hypothetical protein [Pleurocapsa sp. PCC 7319]